MIGQPSNQRRKHAKWLLITCAIMVGLWLFCSYIVAYQFTHRSQPMFNEPAPTGCWGTFESLQLTTRDGERIGAWFIDGQADHPFILLLHGNLACRATCLRQAEIVEKVGCGVLMISLRAHGDSTGDFNDFGYSARHDVVAAVDWLKNRCGNRPIIVWGQSLGSAAAMFAAEELGHRVSGYILECPYRDLHTAVWNRLKQRLPPVLDAVAYAGMNIVSPLVISNADEISPLKAAAKLPKLIPLLVLAGSIDERAFVVESQAICNCCKDQSQLVVIEGGDHLKLIDADENTYRKAVLGFIEKCSGVAE
jgi:uncharacterized protein